MTKTQKRLRNAMWKEYMRAEVLRAEGDNSYAEAVADALGFLIDCMAAAKGRHDV
jgi:hypothetical protein